MTVNNEQQLLNLEQTYTESKLQHICVEWFRQTFPHVANLLISVPNGGWRVPKAGAIMVYEGQVRGVADLILLYSCRGKTSLCIEMKTPKRKSRSAGVQSDAQKEWQHLVEKYNSTYEVCHGLAEFIRAVCRYVGVSADRYITEALINYQNYR